MGGRRCSLNMYLRHSSGFLHHCTVFPACWAGHDGFSSQIIHKPKSNTILAERHGPPKCTFLAKLLHWGIWSDRTQEIFLSLTVKRATIVTTRKNDLNFIPSLLVSSSETTLPLYLLGHFPKSVMAFRCLSWTSLVLGIISLHFCVTVKVPEQSSSMSFCS